MFKCAKKLVLCPCTLPRSELSSTGCRRIMQLSISEVGQRIYYDVHQTVRFRGGEIH